MGTIYAVDGDDLTAIANKIRTKGGTSSSLEFPTGFENAVDAIQTGITPSGTKNINTNGTHDVTNYASADVAVPNTYTQSDEGKVVSSGTLVSQSSDTCTTNGVVDTTLINSLDVNVSGGGGQVVTLLASGSYTKTDEATSNDKVDIPVSFTGTPTQVFVYAPDPVTTVQQTCKWAWQVKQEAEMEANYGAILATHRVRYTNGNYSNYLGNISLRSDNTILRCNQQTNSFHVYNNTFNWYIWGYAAT